MGVQDALAFIREARRGEAVGREVEALPDDEVSFEALARIGARAGFRFDPEDLERAHALDWSMRAARYRRERS